MRIGICAGLDLAPRALAAGFDYVEVGASGFTLREDFDAAQYRELKAEAANLFFPGTIKLFGSEATPWWNYAQNAVDRAAQIGIEVIVIGSGGARRAPEGVHDAEAAFVEVAGQIADYARARGIVIAPESLNQSETNVGNDLAILARSLSARGVGYTADSYHVLVEAHGNPNWESQIPFCPTHVHVGDLPRNAPEPEDPHIQGFAKRLKELGYDGRISLEARLRADTDEELRRVRDNLQAIFG